jgi:hypothetical protein
MRQELRRLNSPDRVGYQFAELSALPVGMVLRRIAKGRSW